MDSGMLFECKINCQIIMHGGAYFRFLEIHQHKNPSIHEKGRSKWKLYYKTPPFQVHALNTRSGIYLPLHVHFVRNTSYPSRYTLNEGSSRLEHSHKIQITFHTKEDAIVIF